MPLMGVQGKGPNLVDEIHYKVTKDVGPIISQWSKAVYYLKENQMLTLL